MKDYILKNLSESSNLIAGLSSMSDEWVEISKVILDTLKNGNKILIAGNGGSAADAQHMACELVNTCNYNHREKALSAIALTTDSSILTAWSNDKSFDYVFNRQIEAHGRSGDILFLITTSGNSKNLINAAKRAKELGLKSVGLLGKGGGELKDLCDYSLIVPHNNTQRIQEAQHVVYHIICEIIENEFLAEQEKK